MRAPFSVIEPTAEETPLIVEIPHAGLGVDGPALATLIAPARSIGRDADLWVDELYADVPSTGATLIASHVSRYVVDLNRSENDVDPEVVQGAPAAARATRGIVWRLTSDGAKVLERPLTRAELDRRLTYHLPALPRGPRRRRHQASARSSASPSILAAHSMPSRWAALGTVIRTHTRADVVPGTRGRTSASKPFIDAVEAHARAAGLSVSHDDPYQGGFTTQHYGRPATHVHVVQVELARRLYMDEATLAKSAGFDGDGDVVCGPRGACSERPNP